MSAPAEINLGVGPNGIKISDTGVEITGLSVKSTATSGTNEISGVLIKLN